MSDGSYTVRPNVRRSIYSPSKCQTVHELTIQWTGSRVEGSIKTVIQIVKEASRSPQDFFLAEFYLRDIKDNALVMGGLKESSKEGSVWSGLFSRMH